GGSRVRGRRAAGSRHRAGRNPAAPSTVPRTAWADSPPAAPRASASDSSGTAARSPPPPPSAPRFEPASHALPFADPQRTPSTLAGAAGQVFSAALHDADERS